MRWFRVFINGEEQGAIQAPSYQAARLEARKRFGRRCDCIG